MDKDRVQGKKEKVNDIADRMKQHVIEWTGDPETEKLPAEPKGGLEMPGQGREEATGQTEYKLKEPVDRPGRSKAMSPKVEPPGGRNSVAESPNAEIDDAEIDDAQIDDAQIEDAEITGSESKDDRDWDAYGDISRRKAS